MFECNVYATSPASYSAGNNIGLYVSQGSSRIQIQNQSGSTTTWQMNIVLGNSSADSGGSGTNINLPIHWTLDTLYLH